jgi:hypothetical protein
MPMLVRASVALTLSLLASGCAGTLDGPAAATTVSPDMAVEPPRPPSPQAPAVFAGGALDIILGGGARRGDRRPG